MTTMYRCSAGAIALLMCAISGCASQQTPLGDLCDAISFPIRNRQMADDAWESVRDVYVDVPWRADFEAGFKRGYCDLARSSTETAPINPPRRYARAMRRGVDGIDRTRAWFEGYRHGSAVAGEVPLATVASPTPSQEAPLPAPAATEPAAPQEKEPKPLPVPLPQEKKDKKKENQESDEDPFAQEEQAPPERLPPPLRVTRSPRRNPVFEERFLMPLDAEPGDP